MSTNYEGVLEVVGKKTGFRKKKKQMMRRDLADL